MRRLGLGDAYDARYRIYDAQLRLFWSKDPLGWVDGYDRWAYVGGDPVNLWDPWGLAAEEDMGSHAIATVWAVAGEVRNRLEQPSPASLGWSFETAQRSSGMMQSLAHDVDEVGIAASAGNLAVGMAIAMTPMLPEAMPVVSSGGEDSGAIVGLMFAALETVAMGAARQPGGAAGAAGGAQQATSQGFRSFSAAKRALGPAGPGRQWHHIVEQGGNVERFGAEAIHNTANLVRVDTAVHRQISGFYSSKQPFTGGQTVRQWPQSQSFDEQMQFGLDTLRRFGGGQ